MTFYNYYRFVFIVVVVINMNIKHYIAVPLTFGYAILHLIDYYYYFFYYNFDVSFVVVAVVVAQFPCSIKQNAKTKFNLFYNRRFTNPRNVQLSLSLSLSLSLRFLLNVLLLH